MSNEITDIWTLGYVCALSDLEIRINKERLIDSSDPNLTVCKIIGQLRDEVLPDEEEL